MISIIDYGAGNLRSVQKAFESLGFDAKITSSKSDIRASDKIVLPGVGAFGDCMGEIRRRALDEAITEAIAANKPFLGICLGLQLLFESSDESPGVEGLSVFRGGNRRIPAADGLKIPHIGWNSIKYDKACPIFCGIGDDPYVYFVHSYHITPKSGEIVAATTEYGTEFPVAVHRGNVYATQFHPEKSGDIGLRILKNFAEL